MSFDNIFSLAYAVLQAQVVWIIYRSWKIEMLDSAAMMLRHGPGTPAVWHGGVIGDFLLMSAMASYVVAKFGPTWAAWQVALALDLGYRISLTLHETYAGKASDPFVMHGKLQSPGKVHVPYQAECFAVFGLYFLRPMDPNELPTASAIAAILVFHVIMSKNPHLHWWKPGWYYSDDGFMSTKTLGTIGGVALLLGGRVALLAFVGV